VKERERTLFLQRLDPFPGKGPERIPPGKGSISSYEDLARKAGEASIVKVASLPLKLKELKPIPAYQIQGQRRGKRGEAKTQGGGIFALLWGKVTEEGNPCKGTPRFQDLGMLPGDISHNRNANKIVV
jgi:hypothetical protein